MKKKYLLSMSKKDALEIFEKMFNGDHLNVQFPKKNIEVLVSHSGGLTYELANVGNGVFNLYQYED